MSTNRKKLYSIEEYFEIEKASDIKHEYVFGEIFAMSGASPNHNRISGSIYLQLEQQLLDSTCEAFITDLRTRTHQQIYKYPDVVVACEPRFNTIRGLESLINPILIVEVLSHSTENFDREGKFQEYQQIDSLRYYLLVAQNEIFATLLTREDNNIWTHQSFSNLEDIIALPAINCRLTMRRTYLRVQFE
ncbi:MAG: Uma2 family endonuclease [Acidobacteria bacterium]|nr:Uma2 family endonuclease [Acidobacteriota bacterium]